jgi:hypothetical protein
MWSIEIFFRDGNYERVENLKSITHNAFGTKQATIDFSDFRFFSNISYAIASESTNLSVFGSDIHYVKFAKA